MFLPPLCLQEPENQASCQTFSSTSLEHPMFGHEQSPFPFGNVHDPPSLFSLCGDLRVPAMISSPLVLSTHLHMFSPLLCSPQCSPLPTAEMEICLPHSPSFTLPKPFKGFSWFLGYNPKSFVVYKPLGCLPHLPVSVICTLLFLHLSS